ncbi:TauD/TfdA family dioxygenase [Actinomadura sp. 3N508]|uniref:TauD/TfdA family dioxygenase n=1 Tax=Actinomadura sp. 3N508 TaxID=3375153 RepID=UPI0037AF4E2C
MHPALGEDLANDQADEPDDDLDEDVLTPHSVSFGTPQVIARRLRETGLIVLDGLTCRSDVLSLAERVMEVTAHRDSDPDQLTTISARPPTSRPGFAGLGTGELAPHTERSGMVVPPRLMLLACAREAQTGGDCRLTDGRQMYADLVERQREAADVLAEPRTAFFGAGDGAGGGHTTQVFTRHPDGRVSIRLRLDGLARFSPMVQPYLKHLHAAAIGRQISLHLRAGQAYLLDNSRWLHARTAFTGDRLCWRALGDPKFPLPLGFRPAQRSSAAPDTETA